MKSNRPLVHFTKESFLTTPLALNTNDPAAQAERKKFAQTLADIANYYYPAMRALLDGARDEQDIGDALTWLNASLIKERAFIAKDPLAFMKPLISYGRNLDEWGDAPKHKTPDGEETPASQMSREIGGLIHTRFSEAANNPETDVLTHYFQLPAKALSSLHEIPAKGIEGNSLLRGKAADDAVDELTRRLHAKRIYNVEFGPQGERSFTQTAPEETLLLLFEGAHQTAIELIAQERDINNDNDRSQYGNMSVLYSQGLTNKRGTAAVNLVRKAIISACAFAVPVVMHPQDDAYNFVLGQEKAIKWNANNLKAAPPSGVDVPRISKTEALERLGMEPQLPRWRSEIVLRTPDGSEIAHKIGFTPETFSERAANLASKYPPGSSVKLRAASDRLRVETEPADNGDLNLTYYALTAQFWEPIPPDSPFLQQRRPLPSEVPIYPTLLSGRQALVVQEDLANFHQQFYEQGMPLPWDTYAAIGVPGQEPRQTIRLTPIVFAANPEVRSWNDLRSELGTPEPGETFHLLARSTEDTDLLAYLVTDHPDLGTGIATQFRQRGTNSATPLMMTSWRKTDRLLDYPHDLGAVGARFSPDYLSAVYESNLWARKQRTTVTKAPIVGPAVPGVSSRIPTGKAGRWSRPR